MDGATTVEHVADGGPAALLKDLEAWLRQQGAFDGMHNHRQPGKALGHHLMGTCQMLHDAGCPRDVFAAGALHSVYGTEMFTRVSALHPLHECMPVLVLKTPPYTHHAHTHACARAHVAAFR